MIDPAVEMQSLVHGSISILLTGLIIYYMYRTVRNVKGTEQTALSHFFLMEESSEAFKKLFYSSGIYAVVSMLVATGTIPDGLTYDAAVTVLFIGMLYFSVATYRVTSGPSEDEDYSGD